MFLWIIILAMREEGSWNKAGKWLAVRTAEAGSAGSEWDGLMQQNIMYNVEAAAWDESIKGWTMASVSLRKNNGATVSTDRNK